jgi:5-formyltetrahydrofolate cyclo-ligase
MRASLRQALNSRRLGISAAEKMAAAEIVAERILAKLPDSGGYLAGYWAMAGELPLHILQMRLPPQWLWCLPVVQPGRQLRFAPWRNGDALGSNRYGIPEPLLDPKSCLAPEAMQAVIVPLLGFTRHGQRPAPPQLIGAAFACQEIESLDAQDWDVTLDGVATEAAWLDCMQRNT